MADQLTPSERYLAKLCERSFLKLWSWPRLFKDQGGKEICDLLVVFAQYLLIFSDKYCEFPRTGKLELDWSRWYRRAVHKSATQIWSAERWLLRYPDRVFTDPKCTEKLPISMPNPDEAKVIRIAVAHGAGERCIEEFGGGSGSLMIHSEVRGVMHRESRPERQVQPFMIGNVDPERGFVHVFDDSSLDTVLETLDTITDFVGYLHEREDLLCGPRKVFAAGEEELLARYLKQVGPRGEHCFSIPDHMDAVAFTEGAWNEYLEHPDRLAKIEADKISYVWDDLIDRITDHIDAGTQQFGTHRGLGENEIALRMLARESRFHRRILAKHLIASKNRACTQERSLKVVPIDESEERIFVFLAVQAPRFLTYSEYRTARRSMLYEAMLAAKVKCPSALDIIGIATEPMSVERSSEDFGYIDARRWTPELDQEARRIQKEHGTLVKARLIPHHEDEYPRVHIAEMAKGRNRNAPCHCGSGIKYKKCCGRPELGKR